MDYKFILYEKTEGIAKITLNRPKDMNAISTQGFEELIDALTQADDDDEVRIIILAGAGDNFCAGHDLGSKEELAYRKEHPYPTAPWGLLKELDKYMWNFAMSLRDIGKPTIAMVQGYCILGGWKLTMACDLIIASEDAKFADRAVRWGGTNVQYTTLFSELGPRKAKEYLWTGDFLSSQEAWRLGMVNRVVPREHLEEETMALAKKLALNDPIALKLSKAAVNQAMDIMGQTAAAKLCYYMDRLSAAYTQKIKPEDLGKMKGAELAKERDKRFGGSKA
jgi:enoyl-CoA hydratase